MASKVLTSSLIHSCYADSVAILDARAKNEILLNRGFYPQASRRVLLLTQVVEAIGQCKCLGTTITCVAYAEAESAILRL